ncbi:Alpha/Beta hydrolase protein [Delphinella strobiligena]|nr:Alpha/Beta hydrolase protein [Delphinella strobiligena]
MAHYKSTIVLPRTVIHNGHNSIAAPTEAAFTHDFGTLLPPAQFLHSRWGITAFYDLPPKSQAGPVVQRTLFVHGVCTPALGMLPLASKLRAQNPNAHFVLLDLWGHGLSSTPLTPHVPTLFRSQIIELLSRLKWPSAHMVGYSFGGATTAGLAASHSQLVESMVLVAPAGLLRASDVFSECRNYLVGGADVEDEARDWILEWLEGGPLVVPEDWRERFERGEVCAEALRDWQQKNHEGHVSSVVAIVRDGGVFDQHEEFLKASVAVPKSLVVLGELDDVCNAQKVTDVGMTNVYVVPGAGHAVIRQNVPEVASLIEEFWQNL